MIEIDMEELTGEFAENKDVAREIDDLEQYKDLVIGTDTYP